MEVPVLKRQYAFNYSSAFIYEEVINELQEVNFNDEIIYRSIPVLIKSKSEEYYKNSIKVKRSYSY